MPMLFLNKRKIYDSIKKDLPKLSEAMISQEFFSFDEEADEETKSRKGSLDEIGRYIQAGTVLACRNGFYGKRLELVDYIIKQKIKEFQDKKLESLLKDHNIRFQISDYMIAGIQEWKRSSKKTTNEL